MFTLASTLLITFNAFGNAIDCVDTVHYRDTLLFAEYEAAMQEQRELNRILDEYEEIRRTELPDSKLTISKVLAASDAILVSLQATADVISTVVPAGSLADAATDSVRDAVLYERLKIHDKLKDGIEVLSSKDAAKTALLVALKQTNYLGQLFSGAYSTIDNLLKSADRLNEWDTTIEHLRNQMNEIDTKIDGVRRDLNSSDSLGSNIRYLKDLIDSSCAGNTVRSSHMTIADLGNGTFVREGSNSRSGAAIRFKDGYGDYCVWGDEPKYQSGDQYGFGLNERIAKIDTSTNMLIFRPGEFTFSGGRHQISTTSQGFTIGGVNFLGSSSLSEASNGKCK